jgi:hypothetical protein
MDQWAHWRRAIPISVALQFIFRVSLGQHHGTHAAVHSTYAIGWLRLVAGTRLLHFIQCAENNLMVLRRVRMEPDERDEYLRVVKLICIMVVVIHVLACIWNIVARVELGPNTAEPMVSGFSRTPS